MMNTNNEIPANNVNKKCIQNGELSPGNGTVVDYAGQDRHSVAGTTSQRMYTREDNKSNTEVLLPKQP